MAHQNYEEAIQEQCGAPVFTNNHHIVWIPYSQNALTGELSPVFSANYPSVRYPISPSSNSMTNRGGVRLVQ